MAYQINLTGREIDERLQNIGTAEDVAAADGTLYARISKNVDDIDELRDAVGHIDSAQTATGNTVTQHTADISALQTAVGHIDSAQTATDKTVTQHTADISALQTAVGNNKTEQDAIAQKVEKNATAIAENKDKINTFDKKLSSGTLRDLYISAGAVYNEQTGFYELNGLTDITEEQMRTIYEKTWGWWLHLPSLNGFGSALPRTNIPCPDYKIIYYASNISLHSIFSASGNDDNLEVVNLRALYTPNSFDEINIINLNWAFQENRKIREVQGIINVKKARSKLNIGGNIETINIKGLKVDIRFYDSQRLSKESVLYMINNSEATSAITIGLNKAVYDVMKDDADIIAALAEKTNITLIQNT